MAFVQRLLSAQISLASGSFTGGSGDTLTLDNLRMTSKIVKAGGVSMGSMSLDIYGMTQSQMDQLSTLGMQVQFVPRNVIVLSAGDAGGSLSKVFQGTIFNAYTNFQAAPDVSFHIDAHTLFAEAVISADASSFSGPTDVAQIMSGLASQMGLSFENNNVNVKLSNSYFSGSLRVQAQTCVDEAGIMWNGGDNGVLAIWPRNGVRSIGTVPLISEDTGMVGYPAYTAQGIMVKSIFNPQILFGGKIQVVSDLKAATGEWAVYSIDYDLDTQFPSGNWECSMGCYNPAFPEPVLQ